MSQTVASFDGKALQVDQFQGAWRLLIDGNVHATKKIGIGFNKKDPVFKIDFPFSSVTKTIEVFAKGMLGTKIDLRVAGNTIAEG
jgi:hypothetical protein